MVKILVADDDELSRSMLELILQDAGFSVQCAVDGAEAMQAVLIEKPDVIITDAMMPTLDGFEFCRLCKHDAGLKHVPIIIYSGEYQHEQDLEFGMSLGAFCYLLKPAAPETIIGAVKQALAESARAFGVVDESKIDDQMLQLQNYNKILFDKLETKLRQLQQTIDEQKKSEQSLKQMQMHMIQQEKMASIGQLAAGVAHEINNPVGFIASNLYTLDKYGQRIGDYIQILEKAFLERTGGEWPDSVKVVRTSLKIDRILSDLSGLVNESLDGVNRVKSIVKDLKSFSRSDDQQTDLVDLNQCLQSTLNIVRNEYRYVAELLLDPQKDLPPIRGNSHHLSQVIANLVVNAAQAIDGQGTITIRTWQDDCNVLLSVTDTGKGIPPENFSQVFEPFFTTKVAGEGTGLGLSISRDILNRQKGEISLESTIGKGSTFTIRLPFEPKL
ncbi:MAG: response regulator [Chlorobium sp.]|nr:response regulator [Chlorobium sp.]